MRIPSLLRQGRQHLPILHPTAPLGVQTGAGQRSFEIDQRQRPVGEGGRLHILHCAHFLPLLLWPQAKMQAFIKHAFLTVKGIQMHRPTTPQAEQVTGAGQFTQPQGISRQRLTISAIVRRHAWFLNDIRRLNLIIRKMMLRPQRRVHAVDQLDLLKLLHQILHL